MSEGLVSGGLVRQARDAVRRLHGAFHECGGAIYEGIVSCEGFVRAVASSRKARHRSRTN